MSPVHAPDRECRWVHVGPTMSAVQTDEQTVQAIFDHAVSLVRDGKSKAEVREDLVSHGLSEANARLVSERVFELRAQARRQAGGAAMLQGALWCVGGLAVTGITFAMASGGGMYVVAYGAVIYGAIHFVRGLAYAVGL
jgi:hypothetical protein